MPARWELCLTALDPAAGLEVVLVLLEEARPVVHADREHAGMDVVEFAIKSPVALGVPYDEVAVWWWVLGLDGR